MNLCSPLEEGTRGGGTIVLGIIATRTTTRQKPRPPSFFGFADAQDRFASAHTVR